MDTTARPEPAMGKNLFKEDIWLSGIMGQPVYLLGADALPVGDLPRQLESLPSDSFVYAKAPADRLDRVRCLERAGFLLVDTLVTLELGSMEPPEPRGLLSVRLAQPPDAEDVASVSGSAVTYSRFHQDPMINDEVANRIKYHWAKNFFSGKRGDSMVVATAGGRAVGFLQLLHRGNDLIIDLIATDREQRRRGAARDMISYAMGHCGKFRRMLVGTQAANAPALALYQGMGFKVCNLSYVFHWHQGDSEAAA